MPVYAHALETPFLNGSADYPPPDPTVGGFMAQMSRVFPHSGIDLGIHLRTLPADKSIPGAPEWRWLHTPGHTSGHISLFRDADHALVAGDAVITINQENAAKLISQAREFRNPPRYLTQDWGAPRGASINSRDSGPIWSRPGMVCRWLENGWRMSWTGLLRTSPRRTTAVT